MPNVVQDTNLRDILKAVREKDRRRAMSRVLRKLCNITAIVALLNFLLFVAGTFYFGGDAVNGKIEAGRYYLWGYHNGTKGYTEVSYRIFEYSRWHVYSVWVTWPLMLVASFVSQRIRRRSED